MAAVHPGVVHQDMEAVHRPVLLDMGVVHQPVLLGMVVGELRRHQQRLLRRPFSMRAKG